MTSIQVNTSIKHSAPVETAPAVEPLNVNVHVRAQGDSVEAAHVQHHAHVETACTEIPEQPCTCEGWAKENVKDEEKKAEGPAGGGMNGLMGLLQMLADPLGLFKGMNMADPAGLLGGGAGGSPLGGQAKDQAQMLESVGSMASLATNFF